MINYKDIEDASRRIEGHVIKTPLLESPLFNKKVGGRILFKAESLQITGSFKLRGAFNKLSILSQTINLKGVVAYSSGNHAQGVAAAAEHFGTPAIIVMPVDAPSIKLRNTRALGAEIILYDRYKESREEIGLKLAKQRKLSLVKPYDDYDIIAGQGTLGRETALQCKELNIKPDQVICPCGGGGLISGTAIALQHHFNGIQVWAAEPEHYDDTTRSLSARKRIANNTTNPSICDAIVTPMPGELTFPILQERIAGGKVVSESQVLNAIVDSMQFLKLIVEPGGCVGLAAIIAGLLDTRDKTTIVILSGGNLNLDILSNLSADNLK